VRFLCRGMPLDKVRDRPEVPTGADGTPPLPPSTPAKTMWPTFAAALRRCTNTSGQATTRAGIPQMGLIDASALDDAARKMHTKAGALMSETADAVEEAYRKVRFHFDSPAIRSELREAHPWLLMVGKASDDGIAVWLYRKDGRSAVDGITPPPLDTGFFFDEGMPRDPLAIALDAAGRALKAALYTVSMIKKTQPDASSEPERVGAGVDVQRDGDGDVFPPRRADRHRRRQIPLRGAAGEEMGRDKKSTTKFATKTATKTKPRTQSGSSAKGKSESVQEEVTPDEEAEEPACMGYTKEYAKKRGVAVRRRSKWVRKADLLVDLQENGVLLAFSIEKRPKSNRSLFCKEKPRATIAIVHIARNFRMMHFPHTTIVDHVRNQTKIRSRTLLVRQNRKYIFITKEISRRLQQTRARAHKFLAEQEEESIGGTRFSPPPDWTPTPSPNALRGGEARFLPPKLRHQVSRITHMCCSPMYAIDGPASGANANARTEERSCVAVANGINNGCARNGRDPCPS
jgi:hypothetical protein